jgi:hypothetical protein
MSTFNDSDFDPQTYSSPTAGLLKAFQGMLQPQPAVPEQGGSAAPGLNARSEVNPQAALIERLSRLQQEQGKFAPLPKTRDPAWNDIVDRFIDHESKWNTFATAKSTSATDKGTSATGLGQFIKKTWLDLLPSVHPEIKGTPEQLLEMRTNPNLSWEMTSALARQNADELRRAGLQVTPGNVYLAHFAGSPVAKNILRADPATPLEELMDPDTIANNKLAAKTAGELRAWADQQIATAVPDRLSRPGKWPTETEPVFPMEGSSFPKLPSSARPVRRLRVRPAE